MGQEVQEMMGATLQQPTPQPVKIKLYVSAEDLYNLSPPPTREQQDELDAYCILSDDNRNTKGRVDHGGNLNSFTSQIYAGQMVTWTGDNIKSDGYRVMIDEISNGSSFFPTDKLEGNNGVVRGTPIQGIDHEVDTYAIKFHIDPPGNGDPSAPFYLDPKLGGNG